MGCVRGRGFTPSRLVIWESDFPSPSHRRVPQPRAGMVHHGRFLLIRCHARNPGLRHLLALLAGERPEQRTRHPPPARFDAVESSQLRPRVTLLLTSSLTADDPSHRWTDQAAGLALDPAQGPAAACGRRLHLVGAQLTVATVRST